MNVRRNYHQPATIRLTLEETEPGGFVVLDQHGGHYTLCPVDLDFAIRFMRRCAVLFNLDLDEDAITYWRAHRQFGSPHSVKVPAGSPTPGGALTPAGVSPDRRTRRAGVGDNVVPMRRPLEPLDEQGIA
jgi:hypothetical protein